MRLYQTAVHFLKLGDYCIIRYMGFDDDTRPIQTSKHQDTQPTVPMQSRPSIPEALARNANPEWKLPIQDPERLPEGPLKSALTRPDFDPRDVIYIDENGKAQRYIDKEAHSEKPEYVPGGTTLFIVHSKKDEDSAVIIDAAPADDISLIMEAIFQAGDHDDLTPNQIAQKIHDALRMNKKYMHNRATAYRLSNTDTAPQGEEWLK